MGICKYKPTASGRRGSSVADFVEIIRGTLRKSLVRPLSKSDGRSSSGRITTRRKSGGHKRTYRVIDFRRHGKDDMPAEATHIEYGPDHATRIALLHCMDGEKCYIIAPNKLRQGDVTEAGPSADIEPSSSLQLRHTPTGTVVHAVELHPGGGVKIVRSAGTSVQLVAKEGKYAQLRMPSGEIRNMEAACRATVGEIDSAEQSGINWDKAGRMRWKGVRPTARGVVMDPVDHPHGGGEDETSGGRHPVSPWGKPEGRARRPNKSSGHLIVHRRRAGKKR